MLIAQINPVAGDLEGNLKKIHWAAEQGIQSKGETLVLPAYALTGWPWGTWHIPNPLWQKSTKHWKKSIITIARF